MGEYRSSLNDRRRCDQALSLNSPRRSRCAWLGGPEIFSGADILGHSVLECHHRRFVLSRFFQEFHHVPPIRLGCFRRVSSQLESDERHSGAILHLLHATKISGHFLLCKLVGTLARNARWKDRNAEEMNRQSKSGRLASLLMGGQRTSTHELFSPSSVPSRQSFLFLGGRRCGRSLGFLLGIGLGLLLVLALSVVALRHDSFLGLQ